MTIIIDIIIIVLLFTLFGVIHSILAADFFKTKIVAKIGAGIAWYRLFYNVVAIFTFAAAYYLSPKPYVLIYDLPNPYDMLTLFIQIVAIFGLIYSFRFFDGLEFLGIRQIIRYERKTYNPAELDEHYTLKIEGPYKYVRHPVYSFSILFLMARPTMLLFNLVFVICMVAYFYIGAYFEEKKLVARFGVQYTEYQKKVPAIFPIKLFR